MCNKPTHHVTARDRTLFWPPTANERASIALRRLRSIVSYQSVTGHYKSAVMAYMKDVVGVLSMFFCSLVVVCSGLRILLSCYR